MRNLRNTSSLGNVTRPTSLVGASLTAACLASAAFGQSAETTIVLPTVDVETTEVEQQPAPQQRTAARRTAAPAAPQVCIPELYGTPICAAEDAARAEAEAAAQAAAQAAAFNAAGGSQYADSNAPFKANTSGNSRLQGDLQDMPRTVTAITQEVLETTGTTSIREIARSTPGIALGFGEGGSSFGDNLYIRGFKANNDIYQDGVRDPGIMAHETFATEQVEILKGPSGTVGGRGTTGGAVDIQSKQPQDVDFTRSITTVTDAGTRRQEIDLNQAVSDRFQYRINGMFQDGVVAGRDGVEDDREGLAVALRYQLTDRTTVNFNQTYTKLDGVPDWGVAYISDDTRGMDGPITEYGIDSSTFYGIPGRDFQTVEQNISTLSLDHEFDWGGTLTSTLRSSSSSNAYIVSAPSNGNTNDSDDINDWTVGVSVKSRNQTIDSLANVTELSGTTEFAGLTHDYIVGLSFERTEVGAGDTNYNSESFEDIYLPGDLDCPSAINAVNPSADLANCWDGQAATLGESRLTGRVDAGSLYLMDRVEINDRLTFTGGLRLDTYNQEKYSYSRPDGADAAEPAATDYGATETQTCRGTRCFTTTDWSTATDAQKQDYATAYSAWDAAYPESRDSDPSVERYDQMVNYNLGLTYALRDNVNLWGAVSTSSNPAGQEVGAGGGDYGGLDANRLFEPERNLSFEFGAKAEVLDGLSLTASLSQTQKEGAAEGRGAAATNTLDYKISGIELGFAGNATERLSLFGGATFMQSEVTGSATESNVGQSMANMSHEQATLLAMYQINDQFNVGGRLTYTGDKDLGSVTPNGNVLPASTVVDVFGEYEFEENMVLKAGITNLFDETAYDTGYRSGSPFVYVAPGREISVTLDMKF